MRSTIWLTLEKPQFFVCRSGRPLGANLGKEALLDYKEKWESLPEVPLTRNIYTLAGPLVGSIASRSPGAIHNIVKVKATRYMESMPGPDNAGCNTNCHPKFYRLIEGAHFEFDELYRLNEILDYRQGQMALAEIYCYALGIGVPGSLKVNEWINFMKSNGRVPTSKRNTEGLKNVQNLPSTSQRDFIRLGVG